MTFKEKIETLESIITIIAIIVGGVWTYNIFIKERRDYPHANIDQNVSHTKLSDEINLLRVSIELTNTGNSILAIKKSIVRVQQILPVPHCAENKPCVTDEVNTALRDRQRKEDRFSWPLLSKRERNYEKPLDVEPKENEILDFEFAIPSKIVTVRIYTFFRNEEKSEGKNEVGWSVSTYYNFIKPDKGRKK